MAGPAQRAPRERGLIIDQRPEETGELIREALAQILRDIQSPASLESVWRRVAADPDIREMVHRWDRWKTGERRRSWKKVSRLLEREAYATRPYCLRCGTCCRKGSPSLYRDDLPLIRGGVIRRTDLLTLRQGEFCYSNENNKLIELSQEQVKISEKPGSRECRFFHPEGGGCAIYDNRPRQCRLMECWNPEKFKVLRNERILSRKDLLDPSDPLGPLIRSHGERCALPGFWKAWRVYRESGEKGGQDLKKIIDYDLQVRDFLMENFGLTREHLAFLLGRPLSELLSPRGLRNP